MAKFSTSGKAYFEQVVPLEMNSAQTLTGTNGNKVFVNARAPSGLISTVNANAKKVFLHVVGVAANQYAGTNALDCTTASHNQWQIKLDSGSYTILAPDAQMLDNDWRCKVEGAAQDFHFLFDVTTLLTTNIDGNISIQLANGRSEQTSLILTVSTFLRVLWRI